MEEVKMLAFIDGTHANSMVAIQARMPEIAVLQEVSNIYSELLSVPALQPVGPLIFVAMSHSSFLAAAQLSTSGQLPASYAAARSALEAAIYGFHVVRNPELKEIWSSRHEGEEAKRKVRNSFKIGDLRTELASMSESLANQFAVAYDATIEFGAHPNSLAFWTNLSHPAADGSQIWQYLNTEGRPYRWAVQAAAYSGLTALMILGLAFAGEIRGTSIARNAVDTLVRVTELQSDTNEA